MAKINDKILGRYVHNITVRTNRDNSSNEIIYIGFTLITKTATKFDGTTLWDALNPLLQNDDINVSGFFSDKPVASLSYHSSTEMYLYASGNGTDRIAYSFYVNKLRAATINDCVYPM